MKLAQTISRFIEMANCPECKTDPEKPPFPELKLSLQQRRFALTSFAELLREPQLVAFGGRQRFSGTSRCGRSAVLRGSG